MLKNGDYIIKYQSIQRVIQLKIDKDFQALKFSSEPFRN